MISITNFSPLAVNAASKLIHNFFYTLSIRLVFVMIFDYQEFDECTNYHGWITPKQTHQKLKRSICYSDLPDGRLYQDDIIASIFTFKLKIDQNEFAETNDFLSNFVQNT